MYNFKKFIKKFISLINAVYLQLQCDFLRQYDKKAEMILKMRLNDNSTRWFLKNSVKVSVVFAVALLIVVSVTTSSFLLVKLSFSLCFSLAFWLVGSYVFSRSATNTEAISIFSKYKYELAIAVICILVYSPFFIQGFFYYDDLGLYAGVNQNLTHIGIMLMRPFQCTVSDLFWFVTLSSSYIIRWFSVGCLIVYGLILYAWTKQKSHNLHLSLIVTIMLIVPTVISDAIGYAALASFFPGIIMASLSVICFDSAYRLIKLHRAKALIFVALSIICMIFSFMHYQLTTAIIFLFLAIHIFFSKEAKSSIKYVMSYSLVFLISALLFLSSNKLLAQYYEIAISQRGTFADISQIPEKIIWAARAMLYSFDKIAAAFLGSIIVETKNYMYGVSYVRWSFGLAMRGALLSGIIISLFLLYRRKKSLIDIALLVMFFPASYYAFLVLKNSEYISVYAIPMISLMMFYITMGIYEIVLVLFKNKRDFSAFVVLVCFALIFAIQNNIYISRFWVSTNRESYNFVKNTIACQLDTMHKIHVYGVPTPGHGQNEIYSEHMVEIALKELGRLPDDYEITISDNEYYTCFIRDDVFDYMSNILSAEEVEYLMSFYMRNEIGRVWADYQSQVAPSDCERLRELFIKSGRIPSDYNDVIVVDLRWITTVW